MGMSSTQRSGEKGELEVALRRGASVRAWGTVAGSKKDDVDFNDEE